MSLRSLLALSLCLAAIACSDDPPDDPADASVFPDAVVRLDAEPQADATPMDADLTDSGQGDSGQEDSGETDAGGGPFDVISCAEIKGTCFEFTPDQRDDLLDQVNKLNHQTTIILGAGRFQFDGSLLLRNANGVSLFGQGIDVTILDFSAQTAQGNGVDVIGDDFRIRGLTIVDSVKDGLRIEESTNVAIQFVKVTWSGGPLPTNGAYGIYPVRSTNVLIENSEAYNASDAGLYVGQSINVIVRNNIARENVAGLEIENTQYAEVYGNLVEGNTGGLLVFDLPGNPVIGRDIYVHDNIVRSNNLTNFATPGTTVSAIPAGTGTFFLASRRVELANNTYQSNRTVDIAILNGLAVIGSTQAWALDLSMVRGSTVGLTLPNDGTTILNYPTNDIWIHDNTHMGSGTAPDGLDPRNRELGALLFLIYRLSGPPTNVDNILYDGIGETVDIMVAANNTNNNHICVEDEVDATFATLDLPRIGPIAASGGDVTVNDLYRPAPPFEPFNCSGFTHGPLSPVMLPDF